MSGSSRLSSPSSPVLAAPGTGRPGVDVLTIGTDWEACSVDSEGATSENTDTGDKKMAKQISKAMAHVGNDNHTDISSPYEQKYLVLPLVAV